MGRYYKVKENPWTLQSLSALDAKKLNDLVSAFGGLRRTKPITASNRGPLERSVLRMQSELIEKFSSGGRKSKRRRRIRIKKSKSKKSQKRPKSKPFKTTAKKISRRFKCSKV